MGLETVRSSRDIEAFWGGDGEVGLVFFLSFFLGHKLVALYLRSRPSIDGLPRFSPTWENCLQIPRYKLKVYSLKGRIRHG